jgi:MFS family permease
VLLVVVVIAPLRTVDLLAGLPGQVAPDEPTVVERALVAAEGDLAPPAWDWPPASSYLLAGTLLAVRAVAPAAVQRPGGPYAVGRVLFATVGLLAVALCGLVGAALSDRDSDRPLMAVGSATAFGLSYLSVRLSRGSHPEHLQIVFMLASFLATLSYDRRRGAWPLAAAGALAGLAGATKYLGVLVAVPAAVAAGWSGLRPAEKLRGLALLGGSVVAGLVVGTLGTVLDWRSFWGGLSWQVGHQAGGHLGYEPDTSGWLFHLTTSLPGTWGWPLTVLSLLGVVLAAVRGARPQRLALTVVVPLLAIVGASHVRFPHYVLVATPSLAAFAMVALMRLGRAGGRAVGVVLGLAVAGSVGVTALDDLRLVRAADAVDTRELVTEAVAALPGPVWSESYGVTAPVADRVVFAFGQAPEVLDCDCYAVLSSYQEERFRRRPDLYPTEVAVYEALRARGRVVSVVRPAVPLPYNWDLLPQWGARRRPLSGPVGPVGPTITVVDLRRGERSRPSIHSSFDALIPMNLGPYHLSKRGRWPSLLGGPAHVSKAPL